jgi:hypothetical protein
MSTQSQPASSLRRNRFKSSPNNIPNPGPNLSFSSERESNEKFNKLNSTITEIDMAQHN